MNPAELVGIAGTLVAIVGAVAAWLKGVRPHVRNVKRFLGRLDLTINGQPAEYDDYGREKSPAVPALAEQMTGIRQTVDILVRRDARLTAVEHTVASLVQGQADLSNRVNAVEHLHQVERITGNIAQGKVIDAIAEANRHRDTVDEPSLEERDTEL